MTVLTNTPGSRALSRDPAPAPLPPSSARPFRSAEVQAKRKRQVRWVVAGLLLVAGSALGFALWAEAQSTRTEVLVAARSVEAGQVVQLGDLQVASIALDTNISYVPSSDAQSLVGLSAQTSLSAGALLHRSQFATSIPVAEGRAIVGVALTAGGYPLSGIRSGDRVILHAVKAPSGGSEAAEGRLGEATVWSVEDLNSASERKLFVSLDVSDEQLGDVMDAAAQGRLRLGLAAAK